MRVLVITNLFPNAQNPTAAAFNRQQFAALARYCEVEVMATLPWFPAIERLRSFSPHGSDLGSIPFRERIAGLPVTHPRTLYLPKIGGAVSALLYAGSLLPHLVKYRDRIDVVLGSWAYPDGAAAVAVARLLGVPAVVKVHGSDLNVIAKRPGPRRVLRWALPRAARVIAVSRALAAEAAGLGVAADSIDLIYNGVDGALFFPRDRGAARRQLGRDPGERLVVFVGNLLASKGALDLIDAFAEVARRRPRARLALVGRGADRAACEARAAPLSGRVELVGPRPHAEIATWIAAADVVSLPSYNEGTPNIVLEALASGRRIVATGVGGIPDLVHSSELGELVGAGDTAALAAALDRALETDYDAAAVARAGRRGDWSESAAQVHDSLLRAVSA